MAPRKSELPQDSEDEEKENETEQENEPSESYSDIEDIPGIGPATLAKLKEIGYSTPESLATASIIELVKAGISEKVASKIISEARGKVETSFVTALDLLEKRKSIRRITTGSKALDELLGGGIETMSITEFFGEFGTGKSQICHQLSVNVQLPYEKGGLAGGALYIDTENTFRPERIMTMAANVGLDPQEALKNIIVAEAYNSDHQMLILERSDEIIKEKNIKLVIIDSLTAHFRSEYLGRDTLALRQQKLNNHLHRLERLAVAFNLATVVTNQVMAKPDEFFGLGTYPIGGHILGHRSQTRVFLRKAAGGKGNRVARLVVAVDRPEGETVFKIDEKGISDVEPSE
ncbi:MAG: DNA repair and recombination protein RadA [Thermoproteota archaeon]